MPFFLIVFLWSCTSSAPSYRESLEILSMLDNGDILDVRFTKGDTGIFKGQGQFRMHRWIRKQMPLSLSVNTSPSDSVIKANEAKFAVHFLRKRDNHWHFQARSDDFNASARLYQPNPSPPTKASQNDWTIEMLSTNSKLVGWVGASLRSAILQGNAMVIRRHGTGLINAPRYSLLIYGDDLHLAVEKHGPIQILNGNWDKRPFNSTDTTLQATPHGLKLSSPQWHATVIMRHKLGTEDPFSHLFGIEKMVIPYSSAPRYLYTGDATIGYGDDTTQAPAILVYQGPEPLTIKPRRQKKNKRVQ